jgi:hypothetical protein
VIGPKNAEKGNRMNYYQYRVCGVGRVKAWVWSHEHDLFIMGIAALLAWMFTW